MQRINKIFFNTIKYSNISTLNTSLNLNLMKLSYRFMSSNNSIESNNEVSNSPDSKKEKKIKWKPKNVIEDDDDVEYITVDSELETDELMNLDLSQARFEDDYPPQYRAREVDKYGQAHGVGRRKTSIARVWIKPGVGQVKINYQDVAEYFTIGERTHALEAFLTSETAGYFDAWCLVHGGGKSGKLSFLFCDIFILFYYFLKSILQSNRSIWSSSSWISKSLRSI